MLCNVKVFDLDSMVVLDFLVELVIFLNSLEFDVSVWLNVVFLVIVIWLICLKLVMSLGYDGFIVLCIVVIRLLMIVVLMFSSLVEWII